jgi:hypothetical protein
MSMIPNHGHLRMHMQREDSNHNGRRRVKRREFFEMIP